MNIYSEPFSQLCACIANSLIIIICTFLSRCKVVTSEAAPVTVWRGHGRTFLSVREINLIAYLASLRPTENLRPDLDLNPGHRRSSATQQVLWLRKLLARWATETVQAMETDVDGHLPWCDINTALQDRGITATSVPCLNFMSEQRDRANDKPDH